MGKFETVVTYGVLFLLIILLNLVLWGGLIYFGFWCAEHFGLI